LGFDQVRSRIRIKLHSGPTIEGRYDVARGHPEKPMSWTELAEKFKECASLALPADSAGHVIDLVARLAELKSLNPLIRALRSSKPGKRISPRFMQASLQAK
jgi:2-methylcitrate dehydratase PrpD